MPLLVNSAGGGVDIHVDLLPLLGVFIGVGSNAAVRLQDVFGEGFAGIHFHIGAGQRQRLHGNGVVLDLEGVNHFRRPAVLVLGVHLNGVGTHGRGSAVQNAGVGVELQALGNGAGELPAGQRGRCWR